MMRMSRPHTKAGMCGTSPMARSNAHTRTVTILTVRSYGAEKVICQWRPNRRPAPLGMWKDRGAGAGWKLRAGGGEKCPVSGLLFLPKVLGAPLPEGEAYFEPPNPPPLEAY